MTRMAESDWKKFKKVREVALDRFCQRVLEQARSTCDDKSQTAHERYGALYGFIHDENRAMARAFDDFRRSTAILCLIEFQDLGLLSDEDSAQVSDSVQRTLEKCR